MEKESPVYRAAAANLMVVADLQIGNSRTISLLKAQMYSARATGKYAEIAGAGWPHVTKDDVK